MNAHAVMRAPLVQQVQDTNLRRSLPAELMRIRDEIQSKNLCDNLSTRILAWQDRFLVDLRLNPDAAALCNGCATLLHGILKDPLTRQPLEFDALLGSDGRTYNRTTLETYRRSVPEPYKSRSPLDPQNATPFSTSSHPLFTTIFNWLDDHEGRPRRSEQPVRQNAPQQNAVPQVAERVNNEVQNAIAPQPNLYANVQDRLNNMINRTRAQRANIENRANAIFEQNLAQIATNRQQNEAVVAQIRQYIQAEEAALVELDQRIETIETRLVDMGEHLNETDRTLLELERVTAITQQAIEDAEKTDWGAIAAIVVSAVFCYQVLTPMFNAAVGSISGGASTGSIAPTAGRGAYVKVNLLSW